MKPLQVGNIILKTPLVSAPLAGLSDIAFRILCRKNGASLSTSEMVNVNAIVRHNETTMQMMQISGSERPIAIQLFGNDIEIIREAANIVEQEIKPDIIDFNFGCPASDVMRQGSGSSLLAHPDKIYEIIKTLKETVSVPVTAKIRLGIAMKKPLYKKVVPKIIEAGADALIVHGRYSNQGYSGTTDWEHIKKIKEISTIPIIGNGDVQSYEQAMQYIKNGYCDGVMIGRGSVGNTRIFSSKKNTYTQTEKLKEFQTYVRLAKKHNVYVFAKAKIHAQNYTKGFEHAAKLRNEMNKTNTIEEIESVIKKYITE